MNTSFIRELRDRFKLPWNESAFNAYFILIVFAFGGCGIWITIYQEYMSQQFMVYHISQSIGTTFIAVTAASLVDLNLSYTIRNIPSLIITSMAFLALSIVLVLFIFKGTSSYTIIPALIGYIISLIVWILANADNEKLSDSGYYEKMRGKNIGHGQNW